MLQEALKYLIGIGEDQATPEFCQRPGDPAHVFWTSEQGKLVKHEADAGYKQVIVGTIEDLAAAFDSIPRNKEAVPVVLYNSSEIKLVFDTKADGRNFAVMKLRESEQSMFFAERFKSPGIDPQTFRGALRFNLPDCPKDPALVDQISKLDVTRNGNSGVALERGRESIGNSITQSISPVVAMPNERQLFSVRRWREVDIKGEIECLLDPDVTHAQWILRPFQTSLDAYEQQTLAKLEKLLSAAFSGLGVPVIQGVFNSALK